MIPGAPDSEVFGRAKGIVAILDTSVLIRAWLSPVDAPNPSRRIVLLAGVAYDSFTSPAILEETERVLEELRFGVTPVRVRAWVDAYVRSGRQAFPQLVPLNDARVVGGDVADLPVIKTAYAVAANAEEFGDVLGAARSDRGWFLVSENTRHFPPGRNVYGWELIRAHRFIQILLARGHSDA